MLSGTVMRAAVRAMPLSHMVRLLEREGGRWVASAPRKALVSALLSCLWADTEGVGAFELSPSSLLFAADTGGWVLRETGGVGSTLLLSTAAWAADFLRGVEVPAVPLPSLASSWVLLLSLLSTAALAADFLRGVEVPAAPLPSLASSWLLLLSLLLPLLLSLLRLWLRLQLSLLRLLLLSFSPLLSPSPLSLLLLVVLLLLLLSSSSGSGCSERR